MNVGGFSSKKAVQTVSAFLLCTALVFPGAAKADDSTDLPFTDIEHHWARDAIIESHDHGLLSGIGKSGEFQPERYMTRGEFLALVDRFYLKTEEDLFSLTLLTEDDERGWGDGFREHYLPYTDVDRLTWVYPSVLRVALVYDRLYGDKAFEQIYPAGKLHPEEPISRSEAAKILRLFVVNQDDSTVEAIMQKWGIMNGSLDGKLKRGEAAVVANRLTSYMEQHPILPLLDYDDTKFPLVPEIKEIYPMFAEYGNTLTNAEQTYVLSANSIMDHEDEEETFQQLQKLADTDFPNQVGVQYYLSWNQFEPLTQNLGHAFRAFEQYVTNKPPKQRSQETLQLLTANIYDLALQISPEDPEIFHDVLQKLSTYEEDLGKQGQETIGIYLAALETRSGKVSEAIKRYQSLKNEKLAVLNATYYLIQTGQTQQAKQVVQGLQTQAGQSLSDQYLYQMIEDELHMFDQQQQYANRLERALEKLDEISGYQASGESNLSGYLFHYVDQVDNRSQVTHSNGFYKSPDKLVLDRMEMYTDSRTQRYYSYDFDLHKWDQPKESHLDYVHEWVQQLDTDTRLHRLGARYALQSIGNYDVITEWISGKKLQAQVAKENLNIQEVKDIPAFITKYYIDRTTGMLQSRTWRYEEVYDKEYIAYVGSESYEPYDKPIRIPKEAVGGTVNRP